MGAAAEGERRRFVSAEENRAVLPERGAVVPWQVVWELLEAVALLTRGPSRNQPPFGRSSGGGRQAGRCLGRVVPGPRAIPILISWHLSSTGSYHQHQTALFCPALWQKPFTASLTRPTSSPSSSSSQLQKYPTGAFASEPPVPAQPWAPPASGEHRQAAGSAPLCISLR